jgi:hypothetical protein
MNGHCGMILKYIVPNVMIIDLMTYGKKAMLMVNEEQEV